jgi:hypothetical protein
LPDARAFLKAGNGFGVTCVKVPDEDGDGSTTAYEVRGVVKRGARRPTLLKSPQPGNECSFFPTPTCKAPKARCGVAAASAPTPTPPPSRTHARTRKWTDAQLKAAVNQALENDEGTKINPNELDWERVGVAEALREVRTTFGGTKGPWKEALADLFGACIMKPSLPTNVYWDIMEKEDRFHHYLDAIDDNF